MHLPSVTSADFVDLFTSLDATGLVAIKGLREASLGRGISNKSKSPRTAWHKQTVALTVQSEDIDFALGENEFFQQLLTAGKKWRPRACSTLQF